MSDEAPEEIEDEVVDSADAPESEVDDAVDVDQPADQVAEQPAAPDWGSVAEYIGAESADPALVRQRLEAFGQQQHALMEQNRQLQRQAEEAAYYRIQLQQLQQAQAPTKADAPAKPKWQAPEYDPGWSKLIRQDKETGEWTSVPGAQPDLPQKVRAYAEWKQAQEQKFFQDPAGYMASAGLDERIEERARAIAEQVMVQNRQQFENQQYIEQNSARFFTPDGGMTGEGQAFAYYLEEAKGMGMPGPAIRKYAETQVQLLAMQGQLAAQQPATQPTPAQLQAEKNKAFVKAGAARKPNRAGTVPRPNQPHAPVQNGRLSLKKMLDADLAAAGVTDADFK